MTVKVSIIVPNFNHAKFLQARLDSIFNQTFHNYEVILLDDASTDKSADLLKQYKTHPKVSYLEINKKNSGSPFKQWKKGIELSKGELIWIAESDDISGIDFLETLVCLFDRNNKLGLVFSRSNIIDVNGHRMGITNDGPNDLLFESDFTMNGKDLIKQYFKYGNSIWNVSSALIKKEQINFDYKWEDFRYSGDWCFYICLLQKSDLAYVCVPKSSFRMYSQSHTWHKTSLKSEFQRIDELKKCMNLACEFSKTELSENASKYLWMCSHYLERMNVKWFKSFYILISNFPASIKTSFYKYKISRLMQVLGLKK